MINQADIVEQDFVKNKFHLSWGTSASWQEAVDSVNYHITLNAIKMDNARKYALDIDRSMESLFPILDELCSTTCFMCPDPCCLKATVWFDLKDMLFLHLGALPVPEAQPTNEKETVCRNIGPQGCRLPRKARPWMCTLYICPSQMILLREKRPEEQEVFNNTMAEIKQWRKNLEEAYLEAIY